MSAGMRTSLLGLLIVALAPYTAAFGQASKDQRRFSEGDEIEYLWGSKWYLGTVLAVEGNVAAIEYEWGGSPRREQVEVFKLRHAWERKALTPMRIWSDASKKFKVKAAVVGISDGKVTLHKEDGTEVSVPIAKLSDIDQRMLERVSEKAGPSVALLPNLSAFRQRANLDWGGWNDATDLASIAADPPPSSANVPMKGVAFPRANFHESLIFVQPIGGSDGWMIAGTVCGVGDVPSRVLWAALSEERVRRVQLLPPEERLAAVDPPSRKSTKCKSQIPNFSNAPIFPSGTPIQ